MQRKQHQQPALVLSSSSTASRTPPKTSTAGRNHLQNSIKESHLPSLNQHHQLIVQQLPTPTTSNQPSNLRKIFQTFQIINPPLQLSTTFIISKMQFSKIFIASIFAAIATAAPVASPQNDAPPFRVQDPKINPIFPQKNVQHNDRDFVFHIPQSAYGKICTPWLGSANNGPEAGTVKLFSVLNDDGHLSVYNIEQRPVNQHVATFGLFADTVTTPTVEPLGNLFSFPCVPGTVGFRINAAGSSGFHLENQDGRFVLSVTEPHH
ncbi:hypothetical protein BJ508DRAFT_357650 [Ascobolus immersus RN42]|uniref:Ubiquitin 3 binding protein But2 C-terminal domain-containing protein n=1 Tax=Ascobolus immersus RN42 TaxID=1160509 RepID=A0A3N4ISM1_ASCIM|nr:hypothetical protein BJ508DRAFT_357650 [Ascobolus immersus RN42]